MLRRPGAAELEAAASLLEIPIKDEALGRWRFNRAQRKITALLASGEPLLILKLRQEGVTTLGLLWLMTLGLMNPGLTFALVLQDQKKADTKLAVIRTWLKAMGLPLVVDQASRLTLPNGATIEAVSARGGEAEGNESAVGRSGTYAAALLSEAGYYVNDKVVNSIKAAVGRGPVVIESTASGPEGVFARLIADASNSYHKVFFGVEASERCKADPSYLTDEEWQELKDTYGATCRSTGAWWLRELRDTGGDVIAHLRDYPWKPTDPFRVSDSRWVRRDPVVVDPLRVTHGGLEVYEEPQPKPMMRYVLAADVAEGVGGDSSVVVVVRRDTGDLVACWESNTSPTDVLAQRIVEAVSLYGPDIARVEKNGVGAGVKGSCERLGVGVDAFHTDENTKYQGLLASKRAIERGLKGPAVLADEAKSLRVRFGKAGHRIWVGRKDALMALGFALTWVEANPWKSPPIVPRDRERERIYRALRDREGSAYYTP